MNMRLAVLGGGNMGGALVAGILAAKIVPPSRVTVTDVDTARANQLKKEFGVRTGHDNRAAVRNADVIVLCVKPLHMDGVLAELAGQIGRQTLVISVAAGVRSERIEKALGKVPVIRVMPNTPALLRAGTLVFSLGRYAKPRQETTAKKILSALGRVWKAPESRMDAVTALSGSGPAYVFYLAECLASAGASLGLSREMADALARQTVYGAGRMLAETKNSAAELRRRVTSPGHHRSGAEGVDRPRFGRNV
ncbi:MAG: pyrroline-5-carboxylate reductase [Elusimicrobia bacterium]|nr:pyrroline-5-carboxylate reductase [Elusimicrobiota bacterium]